MFHTVKFVQPRTGSKGVTRKFRTLTSTHYDTFQMVRVLLRTLGIMNGDRDSRDLGVFASRLIMAHCDTG